MPSVDADKNLVTVPRNGNLIALNGHQSKILVTDFAVGSKSLLYSTAEVLTYAVFDGAETLVLWVPTGEAGEFSVKGAKSGSVLSCIGCSGVNFYTGPKELTINFVQNAGTTVLSLDNGLRVVILDRAAAYRFWAPQTVADPMAPADKTIFVSGPYLVRDVGLNHNAREVLVSGDLDGSTTIEVFAPISVNSISWNGKSLPTLRTSSGTLVASINGPDAGTVVIPPLVSWKAKDSLPERMQDYDDSGPAWKVADHMTTANPQKPATLPVLWIDDYGGICDRP